MITHIPSGHQLMIGQACRLPR